ncbi:hypothetical protein [Methyloglobulus sp.]|uniref:hypothetical protein n=1 Tax=Methyloglobulus sp. TaxID=2518622 RepID=UPI003989236A
MPVAPKQRLRLSMAALPNDMLAAIGDVTVNLTYVLILVEVAIWRMLGLTVKQGVALTNPFKYPGKMEMFKSVGCDFFRGKPELKEFNTLVKKIHSTYSERNKIEHSIWQHLFEKDAPSVRVKVSNDASVKPEFVRPADIVRVTQDIISLVMEIDRFQQKHIPPPSSLQGKWP